MLYNLNAETWGRPFVCPWIHRQKRIFNNYNKKKNQLIQNQNHLIPLTKYKSVLKYYCVLDTHTHRVSQMSGLFDGTNETKTNHTLVNKKRCDVLFCYNLCNKKVFHNIVVCFFFFLTAHFTPRFQFRWLLLLLLLLLLIFLLRVIFRSYYPSSTFLH